MRFSRYLAFAFIVLYIVLYYGWLLIFNQNSQIKLLGGNTLQLLAAMVTTYWLMKTYRSASAKDKGFWFLLTGGSLSFVIAQMIWNYQELYLQLKPPVPGWADLFWVLQCLCFLAGVIYKLIRTPKNHAVIRTFIDILTFAIASFTLSWAYVIEPVLSNAVRFECKGYLILYLIYISANMLLFLGMVIISLVSSEQVSRMPFMLITCGFLIKAASNFANFLLIGQEEPSSYYGGMIDPLYSLGLLLIGIAGYCQEDTSSRSKLLQERFPAKDNQGFVGFIPFISAMLLFFVSIDKAQMTPMITVGCILALSLVMLRQIIYMQEKRANQAALIEAEARYRGLVEESPVGVFILQNEKLVYVNPRFAEIFGYTVEEMELTQFETYIRSSSRAKISEVMRRSLEGEHVPRLETQGYHKDKSTLYLETHFSLTIFGGKLAITGTLLDITDRKQAEELLRKSDKLTVAGELAAGIAHEIRNPLTSLKGFVQLLESETATKQEYYQIMHGEIDRINRIVNDFLTLAKPQMTQVVRMSVQPILQNVISLLEPQLLLLNMQVKVRVSADLPLIVCEESQLKQLFINIIKNSMEAMPHGGSIRIRVKRKNEREVVIRFLDHGSGIPKERMERLGEPFYTTKEKGTGLGLMMCYKIVEAHNGRIEMISELGKGTNVDILLPFD
ncbi:ATP-binding protein [Brevibacillus ginsengisoli]|uniref:ATP-binding protein n=1 Tax=Brevibacillus ginsengisoli TaxID=363854 RepID=UPI003CF5CE31